MRRKVCDESEHKTESAKKDEETSTKRTCYDRLTIYTDGACRNNGKSNAKAGIGVYFSGSTEYSDISEPFPLTNHTNQRAELYAVYRAVCTIGDRPNVEILTDSKYTISCITQWCKAWEKNGWKTSAKKIVLNQDIIKPLYDLVKKRKSPITWTHVRGHSGVEGNEIADRLACGGVELVESNK